MPVVIFSIGNAPKVWGLQGTRNGKPHYREHPGLDERQFYDLIRKELGLPANASPGVVRKSLQRKRISDDDRLVDG